MLTSNNTTATNSTSTSSTSSTSVFPKTRLCLSIKNMLEVAHGLEVRLLEQELVCQGTKMKVSIEAETPDSVDKGVGVKGTFVVPNDIDCVVEAQWSSVANVVNELNELLNCKRLSWEKAEPYQPRNFVNESIEVFNEDLKAITKAELHELGISTGRYKFRFEVKTVRAGSTLTSLEIEGFAHMR